MQRSLIWLFTLHFVITIFGMSGCMLTGRNFGRPLPFPKNGDPIPKPADFNESDYNDRYESERNWTDYNILVRASVSFMQEPRTYILIPFMATTLLAAMMTAAAMLLKDAYSTTTMLNCNVALWIIHCSFFVYILCYGRPYWIHELLLNNWESALPIVLVLHGIMLVLLSAVVALCGWHLIRADAGVWPRCNCSNLFSIGTVFSVARTSACTIALTLQIFSLGSALYPVHTNYMCYERYDCGIFAIDETHFFAVCGATCFTIALAAENFLSTVWGKGHRELNIVNAVISGVLSFIIATMETPFALVISNKTPINSELYYLHSMSFATSCCCFLQGWMLWYCPNFINSPLSILNIAFDKPTDADEMNQGTESQDNPSHSTSTLEITAKIARARLLLINSLLTMISISMVILMLVAVLYFSSPNFDDLILVSVATQLMVKGFVTITIVIFTGAPPVTTDLQFVLHFGLESLLLLIASSGVIRSYNHGVRNAAAGLALLVPVIKMFDLSRLGPIQKALETLVSRPRDRSIDETPLLSTDPACVGSQTSDSASTPLVNEPLQV